MKRIALIAAASLALAACGTQARIASPSDSYLTCYDEPDPPAGDAATGTVSDQDDAGYKRALRGSWYDCHSKVQYLHDWFAKLKH
jgi:hypothetical protein